MSENKMPERVWLSAEAIMDFAINDATEAYKERDDYFPTEYIRADLVPRWISVQEGMPEVERKLNPKRYDIAVIFGSGDKGVLSAYQAEVVYADGRREITWFEDGSCEQLPYNYTVTHWRERPTYPQEEES